LAAVERVVVAELADGDGALLERAHGAAIRERRTRRLGLELDLPVHVPDEVDGRILAGLPAAPCGREYERHRCEDALHGSTSSSSRAQRPSRSLRVSARSKRGSFASTLTKKASSV